MLHAALAHVASPQDFAGVIAQVLAAHRTQESILRRMDHHTDRADWVCAAVRLRRSLERVYAHVDAGGQGLDPLALEAVGRLRQPA